MAILLNSFMKYFTNYWYNLCLSLILGHPKWTDRGAWPLSKKISTNNKVLKTIIVYYLCNNHLTEGDPKMVHQALLLNSFLSKDLLIGTRSDISHPKWDGRAPQFYFWTASISLFLIRESIPTVWREQGFHKRATSQGVQGIAYWLQLQWMESKPLMPL